MGPILFLIVLVAIALWVISAYNGLIALKNQTVNAWKQIDVQLKRRHDLIPTWSTPSRDRWSSRRRRCRR